MAMLMPERQRVRVWSRGQITIPKNIREKLNITNDTVLNLVQIGEAIFLTPRDLKLPELSREFQTIMKEENITGDDLMQALREARKEIYRERYAEK